VGVPLAAKFAINQIAFIPRKLVESTFEAMRHCPFGVQWIGTADSKVTAGIGSLMVTTVVEELSGLGVVATR